LKAVFLHLIVLVTLYVGFCSIRSNSPPTSSAEEVEAEQDGDQWRRTVNGWEKRSKWLSERAAQQGGHGISLAAVHPANLAILQALLSIGALLLLSPADDSREPDEVETSPSNAPRAARPPSFTLSTPSGQTQSAVAARPAPTNSSKRRRRKRRR
jgi:hypothetical protein